MRIGMQAEHMMLNELIMALPEADVRGRTDIDVRAVTADSRAVGEGDVFVAVTGFTVDGNRYAEDAVRAGAAAVVTDVPERLPDGVTGIAVPSARRALALLAARNSGNPADALKMTGITGTNGKTSVSYMVKAILEGAGIRTGVVGTIGYDTGNGATVAERTTPEAPELQRYLAEMRDNGCGAAVMEVSSHALELERVTGITYGCTVFTNLSRDHLDFHGTEDAYGTAKMKLFADRADTATTAVINADDPWGTRMAAAAAGRVITYGIDTKADLQATGIGLSISGTRFTLKTADGTVPVNMKLLGMFNVYNVLAAVGAAAGNGIPVQDAVRTLENFSGVKGRFEPIASGRGFSVVVDYAHTPDALEKVLGAARAVCGGKVIAVMGCGGDRDRGKRPQMGGIAARMADLTVVTSDNPRTEDPHAIITDICAGIDRMESITVEPGRRQAIGRALAMAGEGDMVVVAGKGHEDYQIIGTVKTHFDDRETVEELLKTGGNT